MSQIISSNRGCRWDTMGYQSVCPSHDPSLAVKHCISRILQCIWHPRSCCKVMIAFWTHIMAHHVILHLRINVHSMLRICSICILVLNTKSDCKLPLCVIPNLTCHNRLRDVNANIAHIFRMNRAAFMQVDVVLRHVWLLTRQFVESGNRSGRIQIIRRRRWLGV